MEPGEPLGAAAQIAVGQAGFAGGCGWPSGVFEVKGTDKEFWGLSLCLSGIDHPGLGRHVVAVLQRPVPGVFRPFFTASVYQLALATLQFMRLILLPPQGA
jgi:hypothetical protein